MVLFVPCFSSSSSRHHAPSSDSQHEVSSNTTCRSSPLPLRSPYSSCEERFSSPLSSSAESISSIKSSCSSRSSADREAERMEKRHLLDLSLGKIRGSANLPLRKHLLVYNGIKHLQRDLDLLDDEELYCSLMGESMEVDEPRWLQASSGPTSSPVVAAPAPPPSAEEREAPMEQSILDSANDGDTWSWSSNTCNDSQLGSGFGFFDSLQDALDGPVYSGWQWGGNAWGADTWGPLGDFSDPLGGSLSRFELQHLFPSQLLLQA